MPRTTKNSLLEAYLILKKETGGTFEMPDDTGLPSIALWCNHLAKKYQCSAETLRSWRSKWVKGRNLPKGPIDKTYDELFSGKVLEPMVDEFTGGEPLLTPKYRVEDGYYHFSPLRDKEFIVSIEDADDAFFRFSEHGLNLTSEEVRIHMNLTPRQWHCFKYNLSLYKKSNVFAPWTWEHTPPSEREEMVSEKMKLRLDREGVVVKAQFDKHRYRQYKKAIHAAEANNQMYIEMVDSLCEVYQTRPVIQRLIIKEYKGEVLCGDIVPVITDLHNGARVDEMPTGQTYNPDTLRLYLDNAAAKINAYKAERVHLLFLGDLIENFMGLMHPGSYQAMEFAMFGLRVFYNTIDLLVEFIGKISNVKSIYGVPGNHDRADGDKKIDPIGQVGLMIFEYLKRHIPIPVYYDSYVVNLQLEGVNIIGVHGHHQLFKGKATQVANHIIEFGSNTMYNLVCGGHLHTLSTAIDSRRFRMQVFPSFYTGNDFSVRIGKFSHPQFGVVIPYKGYPEMHIKSVEID